MLVLLPPDSFMEEMRLTLIPHVIDKLRLLIPFVFLPKVLAALCFLRLFVGNDGEIYINELAPRPHNSGHYSIEACNFSQFAIHNRAVCNWPLPKIDLLHPVIMVNVLGQHVQGVRDQIAKKPNWHFHDYGKAEVRHNRKMGHVTILTNDFDQTLKEIDDTHIWDD